MQRFFDLYPHFSERVHRNFVIELQVVEKRFECSDFSFHCFYFVFRYELLQKISEDVFVDFFNIQCPPLGGKVLKKLVQIQPIGFESMNTEIFFDSAVQQKIGYSFFDIAHNNYLNVIYDAIIAFKFINIK